MAKVIGSAVNGAAHLVEQRLSDGSKAYNVKLEDSDGEHAITIACTDESRAQFLMDWLDNTANVTDIS